MQPFKTVPSSLLVALGVLPANGFWQPATRSGQELFTRRCGLCHGSTGEGASGPDLTNPSWQASVSDQEMENAVRNGVRGTAMPAFAAQLQPAEIRSLIK